MNKYISTLVVAVTCLLAACHTDIVYTKFATIPSNEWHVDSVVRFEVPITDASAAYRTLVYVRHTERYPYQNMWLFIRNANHCDTIEFYLADDRGQWLGNSNHGFIEMPVLLDENRHFPDTGTYVIEIQHGLRDTVLRGIADVGFEVLRVE